MELQYADDEDELESDRWLCVESEGSRQTYQDVERFTATVTDLRSPGG
jgi:hypothetical protein